MEVEINLVGVVLAVIASMIIGSIWYSKPLFGEEWMKLSKINEKKAKQGAPKAMAAMFILAVLAAYVMAHVTYLSYSVMTDQSFQMAGITTGFWMWLGFGMFSILGNGMFEQRPPKLIMINAGNQLVTFVAMGAIIGAVGL